MQKQLAPIMRCPVSGEKLTLQIHEENQQEVREGMLTSISGRYSYPIVDGVVELLPQIDEQTLTERVVRDQKKRNWEIERQRPYLNDNPNAPWIWPSFAANVEQGLTQVNLKDSFVLDVGCATCWSTRMICERGARAVALDISTGILRDGEAQFAAGVYFDRIAATMTQLPFNDHLFDFIFASAAVHHADSLQTTFQEFARVLKPNGTMILVNEPVLGKLRQPSDFGQEEIEEGMNEHIYSLSEYLHLAVEAGFKPMVLFPADLRRQLNGEIPPPSTLVRLMKPIWRMTPAFAREWSLIPGHWLVGLSLTMVAQKQ